MQIVGIELLFIYLNSEHIYDGNLMSAGWNGKARARSEKKDGLWLMVGKVGKVRKN